ncbi:endonuclease/exonuclease/phosphatase family protein [Luminiphilus syltensis NOR5-1B]|uniref:Endonuclease/exonuclease/phosphatase family protein n=1 Tax=Luminiphilus syltensis NOR5-1B TaxID=565045 RepID=B8KU33_9GAMM|nr:endonuclease/exonuclease/phosphatase family protein [Luminiphilus syltensis]EED36229.1 endonuclease/exonuclease/phosphatase family protein [Luminiphilus syltensis NOR5-1B]
MQRNDRPQRRLILLLAIAISLLCGRMIAADDAAETNAGEQTLGLEACLKTLHWHSPQGYSGLDPEAIRLVNWNIEKGTNPLWADDLANFLSSTDLITLQEGSPSLPMVNRLSDRYRVSFAEGYTNSYQRTGVMTFSEVEPIAECKLISYEPWLRTPKATLVTRYGLKGTDQTLLVINIHGINFSLGLIELSAQFDDAAALIAAHTGPVVFTGDFNTWHSGRIDLLDRKKTGLGLSALSFDPDYRTRTFGHALDHIYVRGLDALFTASPDLQSSDHNPLIAELRYVTGNTSKKEKP